MWRHYDITSGCLLLTHNYPENARRVVACVQLDHVLEATKQEDLQIGTLVNIIGYVSEKAPERILDVRKDIKGSRVVVDAVLLWSAGSVKLEEYEAALVARKQSEA